MTKHRRNGFAYIVLVTTLMLVVMIMFVLTQMSRNMIFSTDTALLTAAKANLTASGAAWARHNVGDESVMDEDTILDVNDLGISDGYLTITLAATADDDTTVRIKTSCARRTRASKGADELVLAVSGDESQEPSPQ